MEVLQINNLHKNYGRIRAVDGISFQVNKGEVFGILGPNGSGKTTTLSIITGIIEQNNGDFNWFGKPADKYARKKIGSLIEVPNFYPYLSLERNLIIVADIKEVDHSDIDRVLKVVNLFERKNSRFDTLSLGMKQRLALAAVLLGDPEVLVLDEPTNGLDPEGIAEVREVIKGEALKGKTIILASHILDEVEKVCSHVAVLKKGKTLAYGKVDELLNNDDLLYLEADDMNSLHSELQDCNFVKTLKQEPKQLIVTLNDGFKSADLNKYLFAKNVVLSRLDVRKTSLEMQFLELVKN